MYQTLQTNVSYTSIIRLRAQPLKPENKIRLNTIFVVNFARGYFCYILELYDLKYNIEDNFTEYGVKTALLTCKRQVLI